MKHNRSIVLDGVRVIQHRDERLNGYRNFEGRRDKLFTEDGLKKGNDRVRENRSYASIVENRYK